MASATELSQQYCTACKGGTEPLDIPAARAMLEAVPHWRLVDGSTVLQRRFSFKNYRQALAFVNAVSALAEAEKHHPDIAFGWGYAQLRLQTHAIGGLHANDFILAAKIDRLSGAE